MRTGDDRRLRRRDGRRPVARRTHDQPADPPVLARGRPVGVGRVAGDRDDPRVARAPRVRLRELLRQRPRALPPLPRRPPARDDPPEPPAVPVVHHAQVVDVPELVQEDATRVAQPRSQVDRPRPLRVDAARRRRAAPDSAPAARPPARARSASATRRPTTATAPAAPSRAASRARPRRRPRGAAASSRPRRRPPAGPHRPPPAPPPGHANAPPPGVMPRDRLTTITGTRAVSSAGQSACLTSRRSPVRARDRPSCASPPSKRAPVFLGPSLSVPDGGVIGVASSAGGVDRAASRRSPRAG